MTSRFRPPGVRRVPVDFSLPVVTKQSHKAECDINTILRQYQRTGVIAHVAQGRPDYRDLPDVGDYQEALALVETAAAGFGDLPSGVRDRYRNDPARFLEAVQAGFDDDFLRSAGILRPARSEVRDEPASGGDDGPAPAG